jgi:hypothetical protein
MYIILADYLRNYLRNPLAESIGGLFAELLGGLFGRTIGADYLGDLIMCQSTPKG